MTRTLILLTVLAALGLTSKELLAAPAAPATGPASQPAEAQQWLDAVLAGRPGDAALGETAKRLRAALAAPENESLAGRVVEAARERPLHRAVLLDLLDERVGTPDRPGVKGPYLKGYAGLLLDVLEGKLPAMPKDPPLPSRWSLAAKGDVLLLYLRAYPEDKETADRAAKVARPCAKVSDLLPWDQAPRGGRGGAVTSSGLDIRTVWRLLLHCGVLSEGMKLADALKILGEPTSEGTSRGGQPPHVTWSYAWPRRLAPPSIRAELKDGMLSGFRVTR